VELVPQLALPLLGQRRRAKHRQALNFAAVKQLTRHQSGLNGLANTDIIRNQQAHRVQFEGHQQRHQLIGARLKAQPGKRAERPGAGAKAQPHSIPQQPGGAVIAYLNRVGQIKGGGGHAFQRQVNASHFIIRAAQRAQDEQISSRIG